MKNNLFILLAATLFLFTSCANSQTKTTNTNLSATEFSEKMKEVPTAVIIDVRTPEEFEKGHLINAINIDWNGSDFENQISKLDKSKPILVYCLSGGRSSSAAKQMRTDGFEEVYELSGGIMKWRADNLPEATNEATSSTGMTKQQFDELTNSDKLVLVDFYADWCAPCKKMKPFLDEISKEMAANLIIIRINADENQQLCNDLKIDALPTLQLYKNNAMAWSNIGFLSKEDLIKKLK